MMKKKIFIFTIVLALLLSFAPNSVNAANNRLLNQKRIEERKKFYIAKPTKAQIRAVGSELEYYKQVALEEVDSIYYDSSSNKYTNEIKNIINEYYENLSNEINNAENTSDLVVGAYSFFGFPILVYTDAINDKLYTLNTLVMFDVEMIEDNTPSEFKDLMLESVNSGFDCYNSQKSEYSDYYYSMIQGDKNKASNLISSASDDWLSLAEVLGKARVITSGYDELYNFSESLSEFSYCDYDYDDDYDDYDDYDYDDDEKSSLAMALGINTAPSIELGSQLYKKEKIANAKTAVEIYLRNYVERQLVNANYPVDSNINNMLETAINHVKSSNDMDEIISNYERTIEKFVKMTGVEYKDYNSARYKRLVKQIEELGKIYTDDTIYSSNGISDNEYIMDSAKNLIDFDYILYDVEIPQNAEFIERLKDVLDQTLTYNEELKQLQAEFVSELNGYKNNKKYDQTKVVSIVNEGVKKINASTDIDEVWDLYYEYIEKADKTIYKFKITTSKVGKGTISKSKTVEYGQSYTVKIKPNVGYKISAIYVDGKKVKLTEKYTFKKITKKHTIKVIFK